MKKVLKLLLVLALSLSMVFFVGCAGNGDDPAPAETEAPDEAPEAAEEAPEPEDDPVVDADVEPVHLTFQYIGGTVPAQDGVIEEAIAAFEARYPHITVTTIHVNWGDGHSQFMNSVMAGTAPDIAMLGGTWCVWFMENDFLRPIANYVSQELIDIFIPAGFDIMTRDGVKYGLPWDGCTWGVIYRTDLFEEAGLDGVPTDWDELREAGQIMLDELGIPLLTVSAWGYEVDDYYLPFLWQAGGEVCVVDENGQWVSAMNTPEALMAAEFYMELIDSGFMPREITGMDFEAVLNSFVAGDTAMMVAGMWNIGTLQGMSEMDGLWATAQMWGGPGGRAVLSYPNTVHITTQSEHPVEAGMFLEFFYNEGFYDQFTIVSGVFSFTLDFPYTEYAQDPMLRPFIADGEFGRNRPATSLYEEFRIMHFNPGVQAMIEGTITPEEFSVMMEEAFNNLH